VRFNKDGVECFLWDKSLSMADTKVYRPGTAGGRWTESWCVIRTGPDSFENLRYDGTHRALPGGGGRRRSGLTDDAVEEYVGSGAWRELSLQEAKGEWSGMHMRARMANSKVNAAPAAQDGVGPTVTDAPADQGDHW
jgi:hypothetical protein